MESWKNLAETRIKALESESGGSVNLSAIETRLAQLETTPCGQADRIAAIEAKASAEATAQDALESDHIPTP